eukprot:160958_1
MTIINSMHDFDTRILFNSPLLFLLYITNPKFSNKIYHRQQHGLSLRETKSNPLTSIKFINHDIAIRTQYFLEFRLISICFLTFMLSTFSLNPLLLFYIRFNYDTNKTLTNITSFNASLIYPFFYGSCILSLPLWILLSRLNIWNMGILSLPQTDMQITNFKRNSYENRINGYLICLQWLLFGFTISLYLLSVAQNYYHSVIAICIVGIFYPNLFITSSSILIYSINQLTFVKYAYKFITASIIFAWILLPILTSIIAVYLAYWAPFLFMGFTLSLFILYVMCVGATKKTKSEIECIDENNIDIDSDSDAIPLIINENNNENKEYKYEDEYMDIQNDNASIWTMVGCDKICKYNRFIMSGSIVMFQLNTFLLNIESFLLNLCLSIYFTWYCMCIYNDLNQSFIISSIQMGITGVCVIINVMFLSKYLFKLYYYYSFRIWINMCCIVLSVIMASQYEKMYLYWIFIPIIMNGIVMLNISTNLIINNNAPNGCYGFINASNQIFKLTAFIVGPMLMAMFSTFNDGNNLYTFWKIIIHVLSIQLSIIILITFIQGFVYCFCSNDDKQNHKYHLDYEQT